MTGSTDLAAMLAELTVSRRPGSYVVVSLPEAVPLGEGVEALVTEVEGISVTATLATAERNGWPYDVELAWLTLDVHSSLEAVGLTAAVSSALAHRGIPCNVLAGRFHDHLLVPVARTDDALDCLRGLSGR